MTIYSLSTVLNFGQYKGLTVEAVSKFNARYLGYMHNNVDWFKLSDDAKKHVAPKVREERQQSFNRQEAWAWGFGAAAKSAADASMRRNIRIEHAERYAAGQEAETDVYGEITWKQKDKL